MRRRLLLAAVFLLAGAIVAVAVAWFVHWRTEVKMAAVLQPTPFAPSDFEEIPLVQSWPDFAFSAACFALILWSLTCGQASLRRRIRIQRGQCPKCAYPMGDSDTCTECGRALPGRSEARAQPAATVPAAPTEHSSQD